MRAEDNQLLQGLAANGRPARPAPPGVRLPENVRAGVLPALAEHSCFAAVRGTSLRISPHLHVTDEDVERLFGALAAAVQRSSGTRPSA
jgi:hypothetical protein